MEWFGTDCYKILGEFLLGTEFGFKSLPQELSALVYLERKVLDGRIALSRDRSAVYYNPLAVQPLLSGSFPSLKQFWSKLASSEPGLPECWVCQLQCLSHPSTRTDAIRPRQPVMSNVLEYCQIRPTSIST